MRDDHIAPPGSDSPPLPDGLAAPARRALASAGVTALRHLTTLTEGEVRLMHGMGPKAIALLRSAMHAAGLDFAHP
jgi:hypothetical protein